ncbi:S1 family peptidase [Tenacibaculum agarivorans]|uniref:S1 family peptidase n=1 Tax=Tenacibaculum agarivorans TaxID=1908389 RepID=UPI00094B877D|nr:serine protease [Tenacibaculum agarivorans]
MKLFKAIAIIFTLTLISNCSTTQRLQKTPIGLINNVSYKDAKFNNPNASNAFLVDYNNTTYAITAKHILIIAKNDKMKFIDFEGSLKEWKMHPKNDSTQYIITDKLLNTNRKDSLTWNYMNTNWNTYNDWLVFSVKENTTNHKPLKFRASTLQKGEPLYAIGWTYKDSIGNQRVYEYTFDKTENNYHSLLQIKGPKSLGGLSGSPVVDQKGKVVGLVTSGWKDDKTQETWLEITPVDNIISFLSKIK